MQETSYADRATSAVHAGRPEGPLTVEVMSTLDQAQGIATEVQQRLYHLRERLLGSPPSPAEPSLGKTNSAHFRGEHADRSSMLLRALNEIDAISSDLANRL